LPTESLTEEEQEFMRTMEQVDAWLEAEMAKTEQKAEQRKQQEIAANLLRKNIPLEIISETTGVSIEQLQILRSQLENT
jgi:predicted metal-dependent hydrolase